MKNLYYALFLLHISSAQVLTGLPLVGGYNIVTNPSGPMYQYALSAVLYQHPELSIGLLVQVQQQLVNGINYLFIFQTSNSKTVQYVINVPLNYQSLTGPNNNSPSSIPNTSPTVDGGYSIVRNPSGNPYQYALGIVLLQHPELNIGQLVQVQQQVVNGINYLFIFQINYSQTVQYIVYVPPNNNISPPSHTATTTTPKTTASTTISPVLLIKAAIKVRT